MQGAQVQSLARQIRSHVWHGLMKKIKRLDFLAGNQRTPDGWGLILLSQCYFPGLDGIYWYDQRLPESTCGERFSLSFQKFSILVLTVGKRTTETKSHFGLVRFHFIISGGKKWIEYALFFISQECVLPSISFMWPPQTPRCDNMLISNQFLSTKRYKFPSLFSWYHLD